MAEKGFERPVTLRQIVRQDRDYSIFLLEGGEVIFFPAWPEGEWNIGDVHRSARHRRATDIEMEFYLRQIAPEMDWRVAKAKLWRSVELFDIEGSPEKEKGIEDRILSWSQILIGRPQLRVSLLLL